MRSVQPQQFRLDYDEFAFETNLPLHSLLSKYLTSDFHFNLRENSLLDLRGGHRFDAVHSSIKVLYQGWGQILKKKQQLVR